MNRFGKLVMSILLSTIFFVAMSQLAFAQSENSNENGGASRVACEAASWSDADAHFGIGQIADTVLTAADSAYDFSWIPGAFDTDSCEVLISDNLVRIEFCRWGLPATIYIRSHGAFLQIVSVCQPVLPDEIIVFHRVASEWKEPIHFLTNKVKDQYGSGYHFEKFPALIYLHGKNSARKDPRHLVTMVTRAAHRLDGIFMKMREKLNDHMQSQLPER